VSNFIPPNFTQPQPLPLHIITMVLNGEPFIRHHIDQFARLSVPWHWHIVEGVAALRHDTAWSLRYDGHIPEDLHHQGRSIDGTTEYLDELAKQYPQNITVYRKPPGHAWDGKIEMLATPLANIPTDCLLWRIDADEIWTTEQLQRGYQLFADNPAKTAAVYWCWFFVGPSRLIATRGGFGNNPQAQWIRTWRYRPGMRWASADPAVLAELAGNNQWRNLAAVNPFMHHETEAAGLVFQHFSLATEAQCKFKTAYYGFRRMPERWRAVQAVPELPFRLADYFPWVGDETLIDRADRANIKPLFDLPEPDQSWWPARDPNAREPHIVIDGFFFQLQASGIARLWKSLLERWAGSEFANHFVVLDRGGTAPKIPGIRYRLVPLHSYNDMDQDRRLLQAVCDDERADLFISTYYSTPLTTPAALIVYDMIPEVCGHDLREPMWIEKHQALRYVKHFMAISENTRNDLVRLMPHVAKESVTVAYCGIDPRFKPAPPQSIDAFKRRYNITRPYYLYVGLRDQYKNALALFQAYSLLPDRADYQLVCTGSHTHLEPELQPYVTPDDVRLTGQVSDDDLVAAYFGAVAMVYPSRYEGFGLPIGEALSCGCPVITCRRASIPEIGGDAPMYIPDDDPNTIAAAMVRIRDPKLRDEMAARGLEQVKQFSWSRMADTVRDVLLRVASSNK